MIVKYSGLSRLMIILSVLNDWCVNCASLRLRDDINQLDHTLEAEKDVLLSLAEDVCADLEFYRTGNDTSNFEQDCMNNLVELKGNKARKSPKVHVKCQYRSTLVYRLDPIEDPYARALLILEPRHFTNQRITYDLVVDTVLDRSVYINTSDQYTSWTTLMYGDGTHSPWLRGPDIRPWNLTGGMREKQYNIQMRMMHEDVNGSFTAKAVFTWNSWDDEDICFEVMNFCNEKSPDIKIWPDKSARNNSCEVKGLPLNKQCVLILTGKYGVTRYKYDTPNCKTWDQCIAYETAQNITVDARPAANGWDVHLSWSHRGKPLFYNVTLFSDLVTQSMYLPGNVTETVFRDVDDSGFYEIAIGSVLKGRTIYTSRRALFPEERAVWGAVSTALGGAWGALVCGAALLAALALLWRRRRANKRARLYCPEPVEQPPKDCDSKEADIECTTTEDSWELRSERLLLHEVIGEGAFGVVRRGILSPAGKEVAVKMLKDFPTLDEIRSFRTEMELMKSVGVHPHIVSLVGCCSGRRPFIVAEYCSRGDLLNYLRCFWDVMVSKRNAKYYNNNIETTDYRNDLFKCKLQGEHSKLVVNKLYDLQGICDIELTARDLLSFCRQIAMGMEFLASNRLVHRDLAARNVLVSSDGTLKIADFGLSRDVYEENLYKQKGNGKMPMKWMALESLTRRIYTTQSDVWSFGVVMWEIASVGGSPYAGVPPARLPRLLRAGYRMPRPANCTKQLYEVMLSCWRAHPRERPTFSELHARLDELLSASAHHYLALELDADDAPPALPPHKYVTMIIRDKLGWSCGDTYSRPVRAVQSNHYSSPPACAHKVQSVS